MIPVDVTFLHAITYLSVITDEDRMSPQEASLFFARLATYCLDAAVEIEA